MNSDARDGHDRGMKAFILVRSICLSMLCVPVDSVFTSDRGQRHGVKHRGPCMSEHAVDLVFFSERCGL